MTGNTRVYRVYYADFAHVDDFGERTLCGGRRGNAGASGYLFGGQSGAHNQRHGISGAAPFSDETRCAGASAALKLLPFWDRLTCLSVNVAAFVVLEASTAWSGGRKGTLVSASCKSRWCRQF